MHKEFKNRGKVLGQFIEECGEALAAAGKTVRFGWTSYNPFQPSAGDNEAWLEREVNDLLHAIRRLAKSRGWELEQSEQKAEVKAQ